MKKVCLIIPCYNEELRLDLHNFISYQENIRFVFVNDGSTDKTAEIIEKQMPLQSKLLDLKRNQGKAEAVRQGFLYAIKHPDLQDCEWFGFWDADLATPLFEVENMMKYLEMFNPTADAIFGSRVKRSGSLIKRNPKRHYLGRAFVTISSLYLNISAYDSQCGAKIFRRHFIERVFSKPFVSKWIFDVEIIVRMQDLSIMEYPLQQWIDVAGSKVKVLKESFRVLFDLYKIKRLCRDNSAIDASVQ